MSCTGGVIKCAELPWGGGRPLGCLSVLGGASEVAGGSRAGRARHGGVKPQLCKGATSNLMLLRHDVECLRDLPGLVRQVPQ